MERFSNANVTYSDFSHTVNHSLPLTFDSTFSLNPKTALINFTASQSYIL